MIQHVIRRAIGSSLIACLFSFIDARAQTYYFEQYSVQQGLGQSNVYDILQDGEGYIWLGTGSGLTRFDGRTFHNFSSEEGIADNGVRTILQDSRKRIWLGHNGGGVSVVTKDTMWMFLTLKGDITKISEDTEGHIWAISATDGAIRINNPEAGPDEAADFSYYKGQEGLSDRVFGMTTTHDGSLYFITDVGIKYFKPDSNNFSFYRPEGLPTYFLPTYMLEAHNGKLWFGTHNGGLYKYDAETHALQTFDKVKNGLAHNFVSTLSEDDSGNIWCGTWGGGISRIAPDNTITNFHSGNGLKDDKVRRILEDNEGNILVGTNENGLMVYKGGQFLTYTEADGLIDEQVWAVMQDPQGQFWFGTNEGVAVYNPALPEDSAWTKTLTAGDGLSNNNVRYIKRGSDGRLWIGTWGGGVVSYDPETGMSDYDFNLNYSIQFGNVTGLDADANGNTWVGTSDGLLRLKPDGSTERITQEMDAEGNKTGLPGNDISLVVAQDANHIWVGSRGKGMTLFEPESRTFTSVEWDRSFTPTCLYVETANRLWIGSEGHGLLLAENGKVIGQYRSGDGLLSDFIAAINQDNNGQLWVGTNRGLNKLNPASGAIKQYTETEGFIGIESKPNASWKDEDGNLWFGTVRGATVNRVERERTIATEPLTHITQMRVNLQAMPMHADLNLSYKEKNIIFDFNSISLSNPEGVRYKVMLEGLENSWRTPTRQPFVNYSSLPPGNYTFKLVGINAAGIENQEAVTYAFSIAPPFWQTWWFYLICAVLLTAAVVAYIKIRERNLKLEKARLEQLVDERTAEVVAQKEQLAVKNDELAEKNQSIMDSIRYAERIQRSILPLEANMKEHLSDVFVLFKPKDIVSGDFYWFSANHGKIYFSAIDCTGHGVPGAFVSLIGNDGLQRAVNEFKLVHPDEILNLLREFVVNVFKAQGGDEEIRDGMDMGLCVFDPETKRLEFSGAKNPMYRIRNGEVLITKPDKMPVGASEDGGYTPFTRHEFETEPGDCIYLFSDGFADQFGGEKGKKFKYRPFQELLLEIHQKPMSEQKAILAETIDNWMESELGSYEQIDDILVIGTRI